MLCKKNSLKNKLSLFFISAFMLVYSNLGLAMDKVEKLAEYDALEMLMDVMQGSNTVFKGKPMLVKLDKDVAGNPSLTTSKMSDNYSQIETHSFALGNLVAHGVDYDIDVESSDDTLFVLLTNEDDSTRSKKNLLLKSTDGTNWELYKTFPAEWELFDLAVDGKHLSLTCVNCEDEFKPSYIISNDNGKSWHKYSLPETTNASFYSGMVNNKLFVVAQNRNPENRKETVNQIVFTDLKTKKSHWVTGDSKKLNSYVKNVNGETVEFKFDDVEDLLAAGDYLIANVTYVAPATEDRDSLEESTHWLSRDNGLTWELFNFKNLDNESVTQLDYHNNVYHLVTTQNIVVPDLDDEENSGGLDLFGLMMKFFEQQRYSYYTLSKDNMDKTEEFSLAPKFTLEHGVGFNLDYKTSHKASYVDTMFVHNDEDVLKLEFYRLHS